MFLCLQVELAKRVLSITRNMMSFSITSLIMVWKIKRRQSLKNLSKRRKLQVVHLSHKLLATRDNTTTKWTSMKTYSTRKRTSSCMKRPRRKLSSEIVHFSQVLTKSPSKWLRNNDQLSLEPNHMKFYTDVTKDNRRRLKNWSNSKKIENCKSARLPHSLYPNKVCISQAPSQRYQTFRIIRSWIRLRRNRMVPILQMNLL